MSAHAEFYLPGVFFAEECTRDLPERSVKAALKVAPENAFAFVLFDLPDEPLPEMDGYVVTVKRRNVSHRYFIGGTVHTRKEVGMWGDKFRILHANMGNKGWDPIVKCRTGNFQPLEDGEIVDV